jgi:hypothetical protein
LPRLNKQFKCLTAYHRPTLGFVRGVNTGAAAEGGTGTLPRGGQLGISLWEGGIAATLPRPLRRKTGLLFSKRL